ncbi:hypothetical protein [Clostridium chromiireducens]|nr:hypothetical protein [Clostridium chromiireducens]
MECFVDNIIVGISSAEVVPFLLVISLSKEHAKMGTTSAGRNPQ